MKWLLLLMSFVFAQPVQQVVNDDNFNGAIYKGIWLVRFTAEWSSSEQNFYIGKFIVEGDSAHMGTQIMILPSKKVPKVTRKLRLRNFPSAVLFKDGKKVKVWKADFDGKLEMTTEEVRKAINWHSKGTVY